MWTIFIISSNWTEVRRRKKHADVATLNEITYFVSNVPGDVNREEIRKAFLMFGKVSDVYFPGRKGKNGQFYLFIRFMDVVDKLALERQIDGTMHKGRKLSINLEKHPRETIAPKIGHNRREHGAYKGKKTQNFRDTRTFAEVTCPRPKHQP